VSLGLPVAVEMDSSRAPVRPMTPIARPHGIKALRRNIVGLAQLSGSVFQSPVSEHTHTCMVCICLRRYLRCVWVR